MRKRYLVAGVILLIISIFLIMFFIPNSKFNLSNISQSILNPSTEDLMIGGQSGTSQYTTTGNYYYRILPRTGNESLYSISLRDIEVINHTIDDGKVEVNRTDTIICMIADWEKQELNISTELSSHLTNYSVPESISFYKTNELSKQPDIERELIKSAGLSPTFEEGDEYRFCYQANKEKDFYLKIGDNSLIIILEAEVVSTSLLTDVIAETGDANFTHLNISDSAPYDDLVFYMNFDGDKENTKTTTHYDFSNYGNDGTGANDAVVNDTGCISDFGDCLQLEGTDDYIAIPLDESLFVPNVTVSAWVKRIGQQTSNAGILSSPGQSLSIPGYGLAWTADETIFGYMRRSGSFEISFSNGVISDEVWTHVVVSYSTSQGAVYLYIDNVLQDDQEAMSEPIDYGDKDNEMRIGQYGGDTDMIGLIDEVMIFNTSLTAQQISDIYNNQSARFKPVGTQQLNNQSYLNISGDYLNVTTTFDNNFESNVSLFIGYYDGSWSVTNPQNLTSGENATFDIGTAFTNITLNYTLIAGNDSITTFYSPIIYGDINIWNHTIGGAVDTTNPEITITNPTNNSNLSSTSFYLNYTYIEANPGFCWYSNNSGTDNSSTITMGTNWSLSGVEGSNNRTVYCNDTTNNLNASLPIYFNIDTVFPDINITYPPNNTNSSDFGLNVNFSYYDLNTDVCWWSDDWGITNYSNPTCQNLTGAWVEGQTNLTVWVNDSSNNVNSSTIIFTVSISPPDINITFPINNSNSSDNELNVNYTIINNLFGLDTCWYSNDSYATNTTLASCVNITTVTWVEGQHNVTVWANDSINNVNSSFVRFTIDSTNPEITITNPINNSNLSSTTFDLNYTFVETNPDSCWYSNNSGTTNSSIVVMGTNWTDLTDVDGNHNRTIYCNDSSNNQNSSIVFFTIDTTPPTCVLVSQIPYDLMANSTGTFELIFNCTDTNELNTSRYLNARTTAHVETPPFNFSYRPPSNNKGNASALFDGEQILLADGRNDGKWYDDYTTPSGSLLFGDNYSYSVQDNISVYVNIDNGSYSGGYWATLNFSWNVEPAIWQQMVFLSRGNMEKAQKFNYSVNNNNPLLVEFWNFHYGEGNYTVTAFLNVDYVGDPNKNLNVYFCNSSYDVGGSTSPLEFGNPNCVYLNSLTEDVLDLPRDYTSRNSSYVKNTFGINNERLGGVEVTKKVYIFYQSDTTNPTKGYNIRYANSSSGTNTSFKQSGVAWTSTDEGVTWAVAEFTPDVWISEVHEDAHSFAGVYIEDVYGNNFTNFTMLHDDIGDVNHPIGNPTIHSYNSSATLNDIEKNETHKATMQILVGISIDPDSVGNVTHNLTLYNLEGTFNYTINGTFKSSDDSDIWIDFDTTNVLDEQYKMNITAYSGDDANDIKSYITFTNFTIDNTYPQINITYPINNTDYENIDLDINYTRGDANLDTCWYSNDSFTTNTTLASCINITTVTWTLGQHNVTVWTNDSANNINSSSVNFTISAEPGDEINPNVTIILPTNITYTTSEIVFNVSVSDDTETDSCWVSIDTGVTNLTLINATSLSDLDLDEYFNATNTTVPDGDYHTQVWCNDTTNNVNNTETVDFSVDTIFPEINITYPINNTDYTDTNLDVNYTYVEINCDSVWYSNDSMVTNTTLASCGTNITDITWTLGNHNVTIWINDSVDNVNSSYINFSISAADTTNPEITITNPINNSNLSSTTFDLNYTYVESNIDSCWYSNDSGIANSSIVGMGTNWTDLTDVEGNHNRTIYCNDSTNNQNSSIVFFTIDTIFPEVNITYPINGSTYSDTGLNINYTRNDTNLDTCWYSNDSYVANTTLASCINITIVIWTEGYHNVTVWVNDSVNHVNSSYVNFTIDSIPPDVNITYPINNTDHTDTGLNVNYTYGDASSCWYSNDSYVTNTTLASCINITTVTWTIGQHNVTVWANDSANNINSSSVNFTISVADTTNPEINITNPINNSFLSSTSFDLNYTFVEANPDSCWYSNDSGIANSSIVSMGTNWSLLLTGAEGSYNRTIYCNDSTNNQNSSIVFFTLDLTSPTITITTPNDYENSTNTGLNVNYSALDTNLDACWYSNDSMVTNTTLPTCANLTTITWTEGQHNVTVWANDSAGHNISDTVTFTIDISPPDFDPITNQTLDNATALSYDIDATDLLTEVDCFTVNNTGNFSIDCDGVLTNATANPVEIFYLNITVNDSLNNLNSYIMFVNYTAVVADTTPPYFVTIANYTQVVNTTFAETILATDETDFSSYSLNDTSVFIINISNGTITNNTALVNVTIYYLNVTINDTSGNLNSSVFWINITNVTFTMNITSPLNTTYDTSSIEINLTTTGTPDVYWYSLDGASNVSFTPNETLIIGGWEVWHDLTIYANDTAGVELDETRRFFLGTEENFWVWFDLFVVFFILLIVGTYWRTWFYLFVSGCLSLLMGMWVFNDGITVYGVTGFWVYPFAWILVGLGIILTVGSAYEFLEDMEGGEE